MKNLLFEVSPLVNGVASTVHLASASASKLGTHLDGYRWLPLISEKPTFTYSLASDGLLTTTEVSYGSLSFRMSELYDNEEWASWEWQGVLGRIWFGNDGDPFENYKKIFEGSVSSITRTGITATVELLGPEAILDTDLLQLTYAGTGDIEGDTSMEGNLKPRAFGQCLSVAPVCIDQAYQIYQVNGYAPVSGLTIYVFAVALTSDQYLGDVADYAALAALTVDPGKFATCFAHGLFRLGSNPTKKLSADVWPSSALTLDLIVPEMLAVAGIPSSLIGDMSALAGKEWSLYQTEQVSVGDAVRDAVKQAGCYLFATPDGMWNVGNYFDESKAPVTLARDRSTLPLVRSINELNAAAPVYQVSIGYDKCWNVHDDADVSPVLADVSDEVAAQLQQAETDAAQAKADAQAAAARIAAMESDGVLDRSEKARIVRDFETETTAHTQLMNTASKFDVDTERNAYDATYQRLKTYLESLRPAYTDLTQDTPIDPIADNTAWQDYWIAKQILTQAETGEAALTANWGDVIGENKPEDGATVGAPPGTYVGGKPAEDVAKDTDDSKNVITNLSDIIARELAEPLNDIAQIALLTNTAHLKTTSIINGNLQEAYRTLTQTVSDQGDQISEDILKLQTSVAGNTAAIQQINRTTSTNNGALTEQINALTARTDKTSADLATEIQARANDKSAQLTVNEQLATSVTTETGARKSAISSLQSLLSSSLSSQAQTIDQLSVDVTNEGKNRQALEQTLRKVIADGDSSLAQQIETLSAGTDYSGDITDLNGKVDGLGNQIVAINSTIQTNKQVAADDNQATANLVTSLQSTVGGFDGRIQQTESTLANLNGQIESKYSLVVQTQSNGVLTVAGMELIANGQQSAVVFTTDGFSIYANNGTYKVFDADADGVTMPNVKINTLDVNTIRAKHINPGTVTGIYYWIAPDVYVSTAEVTLIETPYFWLGDQSYGVGFINVTYTQDGTPNVDTAQYVRAYVDYGNGQGYQLYRSQVQGIAVKNGQARWRLPVSFPITIASDNQVRVRVTAQAYNIASGYGNTDYSYARAIEIDVQTGQR